MGANGEKAWTLVSPDRVKVTLFVLLSTKRLDWQVKRTVLETAVRGSVGTVMVVPLYKAVPLIIRRLET